MKRRHRGKHVHPHGTLVGYSGRIGWDGRLLPLRMTRKYKNFLEQEESERNEKMLQMSQLIKYKQNLSSTINNLKKENKNNENSGLLFELQGEKARCEKRLQLLESKIASMKELFSRNANHSYKNHCPPKWKKTSYDISKECVQTKQENKQSSFCTLRKKEPIENFGKTSKSSTMHGSVKSQILVREDHFSDPSLISIDLFSNGDNLSQVLAKEFGEDVGSCVVTFGTKKVDKEKSLYEQGIYHGSTVNFDLKLHGGGRKKKKQPKKRERKFSVQKDNPELWKKSEVKDWFDKVCKDLEIEEGKVSQFTSMNGKGLDMLLKEEWLSRSPDLGDLLFRMWNDLKQEHQNEPTSETDDKEEEKTDLDRHDEKRSTSVVSKEKPSTLGKKASVSEEKTSPEEKASVSEEKTSSEEKHSLLEEKTSEEKHSLLEEKTSPEEKASVSEEKTSSEEKASVSEEKTSSEEKHSLLEEKTSSEEKHSLLEEKTSSEEKHSLLEEKTSEEKASVSEEKEPISEELHNVCAKDVNDSMTRGLFGKVDNLKDIGDSISVYDLVATGESPTPKTVVSLSGICRGKPKRRRVYDDAVTFLLGDVPSGAGFVLKQEDEVQVDVRTKIENLDLNSGTVEDVLKKISSGTPVAVRGRVEKLDETSRFKLVVDANHHQLVYEEKNTGALTRQLSQPWYTEMGVYSCVVDGTDVNVGDTIEKTTERIFRNSGTTVTNSEIKTIAVAFKNSSGGDIFVGVEENGNVTGMEFTQAEAVKWREQISKIIVQILPKSNEQISICTSEKQARENIGTNNFVSFMRLGDPVVGDSEKIRIIVWIHVTKGTAPVYFSKQSDVHAYVRVGAETKRITDYLELFSRLNSLRTRTIQPIVDEDSYFKKQCKEAMDRMSVPDKFKVFKQLRFENQDREFKMIFGDKPVEIIENRYLAQYTCGFLNSSGGTILFGVQEDDRKVGQVVGIVIPPKEREELVKKTITVLSKFYPPVSSSQFRITFYDVILSPDQILKSGKCILLRGPADEIGTKWPKFIKEKLPDTNCRVIRVKSECFCIVVEKPNSDAGQFMEIVKLFVEKNPKVKLDDMEESELKPILKNVCIVELKVYRSRFPIHMIKPIETFVIGEDGLISPLSLEQLMFRFGLNSRYVFEVDKFLNHVENFEPAGNSYVLVASPFNLPKVERDLYGLVIPKWALTIDFDQDLKQEGHLYQIFEDLNDLHKTDRNRFVCTPQDHKLNLNPENGVCWLAARGYREIAASLSEEGHGNWNMTHRKPLISLLEAELTSCLKLNRLNIIVLWDEKHSTIIDSLRMVLEEILSIHGNRTAVTFVCSSPKAKSDIRDKLIKPLQNEYWNIIEEDRVYEAPPYVLAQYLSHKLPSPYRPEDDYQVPHKKVYNGTAQILPETLSQRLMQNIRGHLEMMYMTKEIKAVETVLNEERKKFYSGSEITKSGLHGEIGIKRLKMAALEKEFKTLSNDKKSHVSFISVKADRGAGTTTMCLQFLFKHHKEYPCAQLIEIRDGLASYIENINKATKLPLLLLVDEEIAHLPDFFDLKKEVDARNINVIFLLIEPAEVFCRKQSSSPRTPKNSLYGTSPHKVVELRRELDDKEVEELTNELIAIDESKKNELNTLKEQSKQQKTLRTFAHFSLTAFGHNFSGLTNYVRFRLTLVDEKQKHILAFLALTHVFTNSLFPVGALANFIERKTVILEVEFKNSYLLELLSPPIDGNDSRRISFLEVAEVILKQLAAESTCADNEDKYWSFIKNVSVQMAKVALSDNIRTKKIDRLSRKLFVTSEYESEKFSSLIRSMKEDNPDTARDTLIELVKVFQKHTSFRAHLLAHLAKYYMTVYENFAEAKPRIEEAVKDQEDDVLLHHIHGDIIRLHVQALKNNPENVDLNVIVPYAIESSECFEFVRNKRPHMSHGYVSDAIVRITVMQAAMKKMEKKDASFIDYLIQIIDSFKERENEITQNERYLLSLIPDAHQYLEYSIIDFEHKEIWKDNFMKCIGQLSNLKTLYEKLRDEKDSISGCSSWLYEISVETQALYNALEIETKDLSQEELEKRIKEIDECGLRSQTGERTMRFWIRYSRLGKSVHSLEKIKKRVKQWIISAKRRNAVSFHAEFYNYVVNVLIALKDPKDREKLAVAENLIKRQQGKKYNKKEEVTLPVEWLHCKDRHINSIDSLLHHDDLVKEAKKSSRGQRTRRPGREVIEGYLFEKQVTKWEGVVKEIKNEWRGIIVFKDNFEVRFVPQNAQPSMPAKGATVRFCLAFDKYGLSAWSVMRTTSQPKRLPEIVSSDEDSSNENNEDKTDSENEVMAFPSLYSSEISEAKRQIWDDYSGQRMQGVVVSKSTENGFGFLRHPDVNGKLFFHASQLFKPVKSLEAISLYTILEFAVEKLSDRTRAADIRVLKEEDALQTVQEFLAVFHEEQYSSASSTRRENEPSTPVGNTETPYREEGTIIKFLQENLYGFIKPDRNHDGITKIFFHRNNLVNKGTQLKIGDRVQFRISQGEKGLKANDIFVQIQDSLVREQSSYDERDLHEGLVSVTTDIGGTIYSQTFDGEGKDNLITFYYKDILNAGSCQVIVGSKVHFEVRKREGMCVAVKINVIGRASAESVIRAQSRPESRISEEYMSGYSRFLVPIPHYFLIPREPDDMDEMETYW